MAAISSFVLAGAAAASAVGTYTQYSAAKNQGAIQQQMIAEEQKQEELRRRQMELDARRRQMEILRQQQRTRALAQATAVSQGAQGGSGIQGGLAQIAGQSGNNLLGVNQGLSLGQDMFASNANLSNLRMSYADAGTDAALGRGISGISNTLFQLSGPLGRMSRGFGSSSSGYTGSGMGYGEQIGWMGRGGIY